MPALKAGAPLDSRMPIALAVLVLQFAVLPVHGIELVPVVMSLNTQALGSVSVLADLQPEKLSAFASAYKAGLAFPCR